MRNKYQGDDVLITFTLKDSTGAVIDLATYNGIICYISDEDDTNLGKYSKDTLSGFNTADFSVTDSANGQFQIKLQSSVTSAATAGKDIFAEIKVQKNDADWANSEFHTIKDSIFLFHLLSAQSKNDTGL